MAAGFTNGERRGDMLVARFTRDGILDQAYTVTDFRIPLRAPELVLQPGRPDRRRRAGGPKGADFAVVRYDPQGRLDRAFGRDGLAFADFQGREDRAQAVTLQPGGKILAAGMSEADFAIARFTGA